MDFSDFHSAIDALHPFYSLVGEAAATLLGLLFVSVTFNRQILEPSSGSTHRRHAENIFRQFVFLVWLSLTMLLPLTPLELGWSLLLQSLCFFIWIFVGFCRSFLPRPLPEIEAGGKTICQTLRFISAPLGLDVCFSAGHPTSPAHSAF